MLDFIEGEKLYAVGLDPNNPARVVGCLFVKPLGRGCMHAMVLNRRIVVLHMDQVCKSANDARVLAQRYEK